MLKSVSISFNGSTNDYVDQDTLQFWQAFSNNSHFPKKPPTEADIIRKMGGLFDTLYDVPGPSQTPAICLAAVSRRGRDLQYVKNKTDDICMAAINNWPFALQYCDNPKLQHCVKALLIGNVFIHIARKRTPELSMLAVRTNGDNLQYIEDQHFEHCLMAVQRGCYIKHVKKQTYELSAVALRRYAGNITNVTNPRLSHCVLAATSFGLYYIDSLPKPTYELKLIALANGSSLSQKTNLDFTLALMYIYRNGYNIQKITKATPELSTLAFQRMSNTLTYDSENIQYIRSQPPEIKQLAFNHDPKLFHWVRNPPLDICLKAIRYKAKYIRYIKRQTVEMAAYAISIDPLSHSWVHKFIRKKLNI